MNLDKEDVNVTAIGDTMKRSMRNYPMINFLKQYWLTSLISIFILSILIFTIYIIVDNGTPTSYNDRPVCSIPGGSRGWYDRCLGNQIEVRGDYADIKDNPDKMCCLNR